MFPFFLNRRVAGSGSSAHARDEEGFGYEIVHFDKENVNIFAARVTLCESHWHDAPEFIYVVRGGFSVAVNNRLLVLGRGGMLYINGDEVHSFSELEENSELLTIQFSPDLFRHTGRDLLLQYHVEGGAALRDADALVGRAFVDVVRDTVESANADSYHRMALIYLMLSRLQDAGMAVDETARPLTRKNDERLIRDSIEYINNHFDEDLSLDQMAKRACVSYHHFSKLFKKVSGYNFKEYLNYVRIRKARHLLRNTAIPITEISVRCGFTEHKNLISAFHKCYAMTPTEFRKTHVIAQSRTYGDMTGSFEHLVLTQEYVKSMEASFGTNLYTEVS